MKSKFITALCLLLATVTVFTALQVRADQFAKLPLPSKLSLLGNKLVISMPAGSRVEGRGHDIMAAPEPSTDETRVVFDRGKARLVIMANEAHALAGSDFSKNVKRVVNEWAKDKHQSFTVAPNVISRNGLKLIVVMPNDGAAQSGEARLVTSSFVSGKDGTVQYVAIYANPDAAKDWPGISNLAGRIMETLAQGQSQSRLDARMVEIDHNLGLKVSLPERMMYVDQPGPDFHVSHFYQCRELGEHPAEMGIFIGYYPSFHPKKDTKQQSGIILGQSVNWFETKDGDECQLEALVHPRQHTDPTQELSVVLHIFLSGTDERDLTALKKVAETLTLSAGKEK
ncbi:MAG: hypothetical protein ACRD3W_31280 [Terriglobales bacterium]